MDAIKAEILVSLKLFITNLTDYVLTDLISDALIEVCDYINYIDGDTFPDGCKIIVKDMVKMRVNKMGAEGLTSQSYSGQAESYIDDLPAEIKRKLLRYRKLPR